jgi:hypothetical protein
MNLMLHGFGVASKRGGSLFPYRERLGKVDVIPSNPAFGTKKDEGRRPRQAGVDFIENPFDGHDVEAVSCAGRFRIMQKPPTPNHSAG